MDINKKQIALIPVLLSLIVVTSCSGPVVDSVSLLEKTTGIVSSATNTLIPTLTATPTQTPIPTETLTPTITFTPTETSTPTITPTPTEIPPVEWDLDPYIEIAVDEEWKGVNIKARVLVDSSLKDYIESIEFKDGVLAEITARTIWLVWYSQNKNSPWVLAKPIEVNEFMELWSLAQRTGNYSYWRQVQIDDIWVNDLNDGNGYVQEPHSFWPMFDGKTPYGVLGMEQFTFVLLDNPDAENMYCNYANSKRYCIGFGTNYNYGDLLFYHSNKPDPVFWVSMAHSSIEIMAKGYYSKAPCWLIYNKGSSMNFEVYSSGSIDNKAVHGIEVYTTSD